MAGDPDQGRRVRAARDEMGLTQAEFARLIGLKHAQAVSNLERAVTELTPTRARAIAEISRKPISHFLDAAPGSSDSAASGEMAELWRQALALLEEIRRRLPPEPG